ncbi:radical SAM protein [Faecalicatena contorta]|uniref:radical SAM protein n=1 Tax=Faecalicatena contorta TaxID=39482 RepID=UPI001F2567D7|nr:radical SAM protein [Faecalicatena contorta]MCF2667977.1 radical SAM protein [Faecalicatena contorta]
MDFTEDTSTPEKAMVEQARQLKIPITGVMELLPLCNMDCEMCYIHLTKSEMESQGRLRTVEEWLSLGQQMVKSGTLFLLLTGGEPLLFPGFQELYLGLKQMGMILTLNTNGTLIDEEWASFFGKYKPRRINITLYGADEEDYRRLCHYSDGFSKTVRAIRLLQERQVDVKVSISVTKENLNHLEKMFDIGTELGVPVHIDPYMMPGTRERNRPFSQQSRILPEEAAQASLQTLKLQFPEDIFRQYIFQSIERVDDPDFPRGDRHLSCLAGNCSFLINWQGEMRPCVMMPEPSIPVFDTGFASAWATLSTQIQNICINEKCTRCRFQPLCKICAAASLLETGTYNGVPDYLCRYAKESYRLLLKERDRI